MPLSGLPTLNASLNAASAILLVIGWMLIRSGRREAHRAAMLCALLCSTFFLGSYLYYHARVGSVRFQGRGAIRAVYFSILLTHTLLAAAILPLIARTLFLAVRGRYEDHRRWARWTFPSWLYVSATGVIVYWMLYRL
ncbi:MAG: DUF420 domain-containing protein [Elusimicrobiota bacterium]